MVGSPPVKAIALKPRAAARSISRATRSVGKALRRISSVIVQYVHARLQSYPRTISKSGMRCVFTIGCEHATENQEASIDAYLGSLLCMLHPLIDAMQLIVC